MLVVINSIIFSLFVQWVRVSAYGVWPTLPRGCYAMKSASFYGSSKSRGAAIEIKDKGNDHYKHKRYYSAVRTYSKVRNKTIKIVTLILL